MHACRIRVIGTASLLVALALAATVAGGDLSVASTRDGSLTLTQASGWTASVPIQAGTITLRDLPAGDCRATFTPLDGGATLTGSITIWDGPAAEAVIGPETIAMSTLPADAMALTTLLPGTVLRYLPGTGEEILAALDTHVRWRPGITRDGTQDELPGTRRELLSTAGAVPGPAWIALSPGGAPLDAARSGLTRGATDQGAAARQLGANVGVEVGSGDARAFSGELHLRQRSWWNVPVRGGAWLDFSDVGDAGPRATAPGDLPHNDARRLEIASRLDAGGLGLDPPWGLALTFAARGWERNHFVEIYRQDLEHAPREEGARLEFGADGMLRLTARANAHLRIDYGSFTHSLADGLYRQDVQLYYNPESNSATDESRLYWPGASSQVLAGAHVFDYYRWLQTREWRATLSVAEVTASGFRLAGGARIAGTTYRRFEHFAPTLHSVHDDPTARALLIGYDAVTGAASDTPFPPGNALSVRGELTARRDLGARWRGDARVGALGFSSRDSVLTDPHRPYGSDSRLDAGDLAAPVWHAAPEASVGLRWNRSPRVAGWLLGYRRAYAPPLEALYSARPYLAEARPEGVMPNPALAPEIETGGELGIALPFPLLPEAWRLAVAGYAGRIDDAIAMTATWLGEDTGLNDGWAPLYESTGELRRRGIHLEATTGSADGPTWARISYDYGRIETDSFEPALLDEAWLYPDLPQGEYETEGYVGPLGGILDGIAEQADPAAATRAGAYRPSYLDRAHCLSVACVRHLSAPPADAGTIGNLTGGWTIGAIARFESGRPYTQTYAHAAVLPPGSTTDDGRGTSDPAWDQVLEDAAWNALRLPSRFTLDVALQRRVAFGPLGLRFAIEALNLFDIINVESVYRATGEPDQDGCDGSAACLGSELAAQIDAEAYAERLRDALHYDRPFVLRGAVRLEMF
jgi:hypothetical protein